MTKFFIKCKKNYFGAILGLFFRNLAKMNFPEKNAELMNGHTDGQTENCDFIGLLVEQRSN